MNSGLGEGKRGTTNLTGERTSRAGVKFTISDGDEEGERVFLLRDGSTV